MKLRGLGYTYKKTPPSVGADQPHTAATLVFESHGPFVTRKVTADLEMESEDRMCIDPVSFLMS